MAKKPSATSFALQPDLQFRFMLAERLHMTVAQIREMDCVEYIQWQIHFQRRAKAQKKVPSATKNKMRL